MERQASLEAIMMGRKLVSRERTELVNLEEFVPRDHLLRAIDPYLDLPISSPSIAILAGAFATAMRFGSCLSRCCGCPNTPFRKIARSIHEDARDVARCIMDTPQY
jgi:hypothetical protein